MKHGIPVDQTLPTINQALIKQANKHLLDSARAAIVHGEALARPVNRGPHATQLLCDHPARGIFPLPDFFQEPLSAQIMPRNIGRQQLALDQHLSSYTCVIGSDLP